MVKTNVTDEKLEELKNYFKRYLDHDKKPLDDYEIDMINYIIEELENPAPVKEGQYKIPHRYFYDLLSRNKMPCDIEKIVSNIATYKEYDGSISKENGALLEKLYDDDKNYFYLHNINYRAYGMTSEQEHEIATSICKNGLRLSTMGNEVGNLNYTTLNSHEDKSIFTFLPSWDLGKGLMILQIPKEEVDNQENIIGSDVSETLSPQNPGYVLPKYVVGYVENGKFQKNPIEESQRKQYKFTTCEVNDNNKTM